MSDLISRQDAIDAMWKALYAYEDLTEKQFMEHEELELKDWFLHRIFVQRMHEECMKAVEELPSAEPKTGKWVDTTSNQHYKCSVCGYRAGYWFNEENSCEYSMDMSEWLSNFCPNCGARMKGADDE